MATQRKYRKFTAHQKLEIVLAGLRDEREGEKELKQKIRSLERALGRKTYELEIAGELSRDGD